MTAVDNTIHTRTINTDEMARGEGEMSAAGLTAFGGNGGETDPAGRGDAMPS